MGDEVVIVDYDSLTSAGLSVDLAWKNLVNNGSGIRPIDRYDPAGEKLLGVSDISYSGQIPTSFEELAGSPDVLNKWIEPSYHAIKTLTRRIFERIDFNVSQHDPQRIAFLGATVLTSQLSRDTLSRTGKSDSKFILNQCQNVPLAVAASEFGIQGPSFSISSACSSSGHAILLSSQFIKAGLVDSALVVGHEFPLLPSSVGALDWINALYRRDEPDDRGYASPESASRPFSRDRRGFVLSEGAGAVFLAHKDYARKMGWPVKGVVKGGYANSDGDHLTRASMQNVTRCMSMALDSAGCNTEDVECINAHATSTPIGDAAELKALRSLFGDGLAKTPVVANKSQIGHALGASSVVALTLALEGMRRGVVLPTLNHVPDPSLPDALIPAESMEYSHGVTLLNSFGFGGTNVSLVVGRGPE
ncbi:MAG TPA: beta-ketoacyl synthase N-terminal-like domain-containing protein [Pyrinomonadaceae bacterium]|nr:beta-ketoacyl synthase N-terminal-like domain-containing protein [Pyrinomonadaceae bacterium]